MYKIANAERLRRTMCPLQFCAKRSSDSNYIYLYRPNIVRTFPLSSRTDFVDHCVYMCIQWTIRRNEPSKSTARHNIYGIYVYTHSNAKHKPRCARKKQHNNYCLQLATQHNIKTHTTHTHTHRMQKISLYVNNYIARARERHKSPYA